MINNVIKMEDNTYLVRRVLNESTTEEDATRIHHNIGTDTLLRDKSGKWFCCIKAKDAEYRDVELVPTESRVDYTGTEFELGDNGGLG
jgi:hypothetical protein